MELLDYIRKNYKTPNIAVLKTLGATDELVKYLINTPNNTNMKIVESLISGDGDKGNGIKSITVSPAITTTPALESLFPIYYEDLTEEQKQNGITVEAAGTLPEDFTYTITPTTDWYAICTSVNPLIMGEKGAPINVTGEPSMALVIANGLNDDAPDFKAFRVQFRLLD